MKKLGELKNVGKATLHDLDLLGISSIEELASQDPTFLFNELERRTQMQQDPSV
jgi:nucleotidyltransferase/DNA polymerase involved in DNA repair